MNHQHGVVGTILDEALEGIAAGTASLSSH